MSLTEGMWNLFHTSVVKTCHNPASNGLFCYIYNVINILY